MHQNQSDNKKKLLAEALRQNLRLRKRQNQQKKALSEEETPQA
ncbi:hypothetical protein Za10_0272 [Zymomonas mobilis subsp. mobilis NCIMB 11163]|nr:hypothetical protein Za10_0272 [Zymomonas mobilis subsp. mobilis NCIMB 11163]